MKVPSPEGYMYITRYINPKETPQARKNIESMRSERTRHATCTGRVSVVRARRSPRLGARLQSSSHVRVAAARGVLVREEAVAGNRAGDGRRADEQLCQVCPAASLIKGSLWFRIMKT